MHKSNAPNSYHCINHLFKGMSWLVLVFNFGWDLFRAGLWDSRTLWYLISISAWIIRSDMTLSTPYHFSTLQHPQLEPHI